MTNETATDICYICDKVEPTPSMTYVDSENPNDDRLMCDECSNDKLKDKILEELDNISLSEFQSLMEKHDYEDVNNSIDFGIQNLIQILFDERCK